jgi:hypothetical protein
MQKIKHFLQSKEGKDILIILIIIIVAFISFFLGRMSKNSPKTDLILGYSKEADLAVKSLNNANLEPNKELANALQSLSYKGPDLTGREYFASKRGKKYYPFGCSAGKSIKEENRIYFASEAEAKSKGYTISTSCD